MVKHPSDHPVNAKLPIPQLFTYGFQHVLAMYAGAVTVPIVIGSALHLSSDLIVFLISADLFTCGIATLIQTLGFWKFGIRLPLIQGVTFASVQPIIAIGMGVEHTGGSPEQALVVVFSAVIVGGLFTMLVAPLFSKFIHLFPPVVTGSVILAIGLSLLPVAIKMVGGQGFYVNGEPAQYGTLTFLLVGLIVVLVILLVNRFFSGFLKNIAVLIGMIVGFLVCIPLGFIDFAKVAHASWFGVDLPFGLNMPGLDGGQYLSFFGGDQYMLHIVPAVISMLIVMLIVMVESTGDYIAIGEIIDLPVGEKSIAAGLRADGLSTMIGGCLNALPYTAFAQNVGLVALTGVRSRYVVAGSGIILVVLGLIPKLAAVIDSLPPFVIGGAAFVMFATVAANGIKALSKAELSTRPNNIFIIAISLGVGLIPTVGALTSSIDGAVLANGSAIMGVVQSFDFFNAMPDAAGPLITSGITLTAVTAVLLNLFFNGVSKDVRPEMDMSH
ncbi:MAG: purine permease [Actinomycetia bacterium]|nr:purine permease [Actinomycetes bacterium]